MKVRVYTVHYIDRMEDAKLKLIAVKLGATRKVKWWMTSFNVVNRIIDGCDWRVGVLDENIAMAKEHLGTDIEINQFEFETAYTDYSYTYFEERFR